MNCQRCGKKVFALFPGDLCRGCHEAKPFRAEKKKVVRVARCRTCGKGGKLKRGLCLKHYNQQRYRSVVKK